MGQPAKTWRERRKNSRITASTAVWLEWETSSGDILRAHGITRDISRGGVYCFMEHPLAVGLEVNFVALFPAEIEGSTQQMFHCRGRVLRSERLRNSFGIPIAIQSRYAVAGGKENRRAYPRIAPASPLVAEYSGLYSVVRNLSESGAFLEDHQPVLVGREIELHMRGQGLRGQITAKAIVRRVVPNTGMGVEFLALDSEAIHQIRETISRNIRPNFRIA